MNDNHFNAPGNEFCTCTRWRNPTVASQAGPSGPRANQRRWQVQHLSGILSEAMLQTQLAVDSFSEITCSKHSLHIQRLFAHSYLPIIRHLVKIWLCENVTSTHHKPIWHCNCKNHKTRKSLLFLIININFLLQIKTFLMRISLVKQWIKPPHVTSSNICIYIVCNKMPLEMTKYDS